MASYVSFEGSMDYILHMPVLQTTFVASGSITAGKAVGINPSDGTVYQIATGITTAAGVAAVAMDFIGIATATKADTKKVPVIVWGPVKNITALTTINAGQYLVPTGSGFAPLSYPNAAGTGYSFYNTALLYTGSITAGRAISAGVAAGKFRALIKGF